MACTEYLMDLILVCLMFGGLALILGVSIYADANR